jgi:signal transduction histidine kinase/CheY-like chemotaxis protein
VSQKEVPAASVALLRAALESAAEGILVLGQGGAVLHHNGSFARLWLLPAGSFASGDFAPLLEAMCGQFADPVAARLRFDEISSATEAEVFDVIELGDGRVFERTRTLQQIENGGTGSVWTFRDITDARRAQEGMRDEARIFELLNATGEALSSKLELEALLQAVTDAATAASGAKFGAFFYNHFDDSGGSYLLYTLSGAPREAFEKLGQPRPTEVFGPTFRGGPPIRSDDILLDHRYAKTGTGMPRGHLPVRSYLAVSVISRSGEVIGGLFFGHPETAVFTERHERIIVAIAAQAAVGIDNARLYDAARRAAKEREELLARERSARESAERMSELKDEFLANLSHELRTPLNAILGWSQMLRHGKRSEGDLAKGLETIERNARAQTQLVEDLLDMSRILSGKVLLDVQTCEPTGFIEAALDSVRPAASAKGILIETLLDPTAGAVSGDPGRLQQVMWNLLSNAIKFTPRGGKVQVLLQRADSHVEIRIADTGMGIDPDFISFVFDRFRQADASTTRRHGGLGIGLSIVKHLVELHGGSVRAESPGADLGATFTVQLPVIVVHRAAHAEPRFHPPAPSSLAASFAAIDLKNIDVLVVDDEADARELIKHVLESCSARVTTAANAEEAIGLFSQSRPDVLVSDIGMPDVDGYELLRRIRVAEPEEGTRVPAIALTAFARSEDRTRALRAGFLVHVAKPVDPSELIATIASAVRRTGN